MKNCSGAGREEEGFETVLKARKTGVKGLKPVNRSKRLLGVLDWVF